MSNMLVVPAGMLGELRCGLHNVLGQAAEDVSEVTVRQARERHPEWHDEPLQHLDRARALLDLIGWAESGPPAAVRVDLGKHRWALLGALEIALLAGSDEVQEAEKVDAERAQRGQAPKRDATLVRVLAVREFILTVEDQVRALGAQGGPSR
jgi:hypothetical protein